MSRAYFRSLLAAGFLLVGLPLLAQQPRPTPEQARVLLETRPDLVAQLRQRLLSSGLTRDQIHERLVAEGYPADLLDPYLPDSADSTASPDETVYSAVRALGISDSTDMASPMGRRLGADTSLRGGVSDTTDSLGYSENARRSGRYSGREPRPRVSNADSIFGLDVFRSSTSQFAPNVAGPIDENYRLGPGDRLVLILTGDVESSYTLDVTREGFVVIPQVGQLYVANLTLGELTDLLYTRLGRVYSGVRRGAGATTHFSVSVARLRTNQVFVVGDVERPGSYQVSSAGTALTALYAAGGPTVNGSMRKIEIRRDGKTVDVLDIYDYLLHGDASHDPRLQTGDIVFVPVHGPRVKVTGEIVRPATYELKQGEALPDLLQDAGGFKATASRQRVQIERILPPSQRTTDGVDRVTVDVASDQFTNGYGPAVPLEPGDIVHVFPVDKRMHNRVTVRGDVFAPGTVGLDRGMRISDAIRMAGGPKPDVYLGQILISRLQPDSTRIQLRASLADTTGKVIGDFPLREDDIIQVFSQTEFRPELYVAVSGAVRKSGRYPYRRGMTMRDLILEAGGLKEGAYLSEAEIARLPESRQGGITANTIRVPIDSTYLFDRKPSESYLGAPGLQSMSRGAPEVPLEPYDNVLIMYQPDFELQRTVTLSGEVKFPGTYALRTKTERLADIIQRAGGFTQEAYANGLVLTRDKGPTPGRIAIDVRKALRDPRSAENMILMDGDKIIVPRYSGTVSVQGAVNAPTVVAFVPGEDLDYYVASAGGYSRKADAGRMYVTQPNGTRDVVRHHWLIPDAEPQPQPGSIVTVPERDPNDKKDYTAMVTSVAQVTATLIGLIVLIRK